MIVTRSPLRVTLGGGGTDLPSYYSQYGGFIFAAAIDKYVLVAINGSDVSDVANLNCGQPETVSLMTGLCHDIVREALMLRGIENRIQVSMIADIPAGTGLGSSSSFAVGFLHALHVLQGNCFESYRLAEEAYHLEAEILKRPVGKQDHYMAALGGFRVLDIETDGTVKQRQTVVRPDIADALNRNMLMFYTGQTRNGDGILADQFRSVQEKQKHVLDSMHCIKELGFKILDAVECGNLSYVGRYFDEHWRHKKRISSKISSQRFDAIYAAAKEAGALGGKISGAGGGGFFTFYTEAHHKRLRERMNQLGLREMHYHFVAEGSKVLAGF